MAIFTAVDRSGFITGRKQPSSRGRKRRMRSRSCAATGLDASANHSGDYRRAGALSGGAGCAPQRDRAASHCVRLLPDRGLQPWTGSGAHCRRACHGASRTTDLKLESKEPADLSRIAAAFSGIHQHCRSGADGAIVEADWLASHHGVCQCEMVVGGRHRTAAGDASFDGSRSRDCCDHDRDEASHAASCKPGGDALGGWSHADDIHCGFGDHPLRYCNSSSHWTFNGIRGCADADFVGRAQPHGSVGLVHWTSQPNARFFRQFSTSKHDQLTIATTSRSRLVPFWRISAGATAGDRHCPRIGRLGGCGSAGAGYHS